MTSYAGFDPNAECGDFFCMFDLDAPRGDVSNWDPALVRAMNDQIATIVPPEYRSRVVFSYDGYGGTNGPEHQRHTYSWKYVPEGDKS